MRPHGLAALALLTCSCAAAPALPASPAECRATHDARPHEATRPAPGDELVFHEVRFDVPGSRRRFVAAFLQEKLETFIRGTAKLPAVDHTEPLTEARYPAVGSVRLVCLADGGTAEEEVLDQDEGRLRYLVTNYSSSAAAPVLYGLGEFTFEPAGETTRVRWRYSFKLRGDRFPGTLGPIGRALFRSSFLEDDYAEFMDAQVRDIRSWAARAVRP